MTTDSPTPEDFAAYWQAASQSAQNISKRSVTLAAYGAGFEAARIPANKEDTMTAPLTLNITLEEARILAQALDLLASDPGLISDEWPNIEDDDDPELAALGYAVFDLPYRFFAVVPRFWTRSGDERARGASSDPCPRVPHIAGTLACDH